MGNVTTTVAVNHTESLIRRFDAAMSGEAILQLAEEITAIRRCTDKAMRLAKADYADAVLAAHAIQRLANVTSTGPIIDWTPSALDRRFEQLTECVELRASQLPTITLSRYCWALSVLRIADEEQVDCVFDEYTSRLQNRGANINSSSSKSVSLTNEELAAMMWTVGCIRDTYDWARGPVVTRLASALVGVGEEGLDRLNVRILLRVLWTLSLYASEGAVEGGVDARKALATMALHSLHRRSADLGDNSVVATLSACAKLKIHLTEIAAISALLQRLSPLVDRLSPAEYAAAAEALSTIYSQLSGTARQAEAAHPDAPVVQLVSIVEKVSSALIQAASLLKFSALPVGSIAELVHLAVLIDVVDDRTILEAGLRQVESLLATNVTLAPSDASLLLEAIALLTWTIRREKGFHTSFAQQRDVNATASLGIFLSAQRLAGHMSAICSTRAPALLKRSPTDLLSAAWASACYARPCSDMMELLRTEMQNNSFALLHDVDPAGLGKVAVVVATDQKQPVSTFRGRATFDDKFLHELLPLVIGRLMEIAPAGLQVSVLTAIAEIAQGGAAPAEVLNTRACAVRVDDLGKLRTSSLLKFLWAAGRLPEGLLSNETMSAAQTTLMGRNIDIGYSKGRYSANTAHATEFMLLARLLADARKPNGRQDNSLIDVVLRNVLKAMAMHLPDEASEGDGEASKGEISVTGTADLVALSGIVKALIDFRVYNAELVQQCTRCIRNELAFHVAHSDDSSASCRRLYDLGRLEGLLSVYCSTVGAEANHRRGFHLFG